MQKCLCLLTAFVLLLSLAACMSDDDFVVNTCPFSVMVDGQLFHTYYEKAVVDPDAIQPAGTITHASCNITAVPADNNTSNWEECVGQPYAWVDGDLILFYENEWKICYRTDEVGGSYKIMVNGILYYTFSKPAPTPSDDQIAGTIDSCTEGLWVHPAEDNQTNHAPFVGQPYAFVDGNLVLYYNNQWNTCKVYRE